MKEIVLAGLLSIWMIPAALFAAEASLGWPEVVVPIANARTQAVTCVEMDKLELETNVSVGGREMAEVRGHRRAKGCLSANLPSLHARSRRWVISVIAPRRVVEVNDAVAVV